MRVDSMDGYAEPASDVSAAAILRYFNCDLRLPLAEAKVERRCVSLQFGRGALWLSPTIRGPSNTPFIQHGVYNLSQKAHRRRTAEAFALSHRVRPS